MRSYPLLKQVRLEYLIEHNPCTPHTPAPSLTQSAIFLCNQGESGAVNIKCQIQDR